MIISFYAEIRVLGYLRYNFLEMADFHNQSKDCQIVGVAVSSSCSHVGVAWSSSQSTEIKLSVYMLPVDSWLSELPPPSPVGSNVTIASQRVSRTRNMQPPNHNLDINLRMWYILNRFSSMLSLHLPLPHHPTQVTPMPSFKGILSSLWNKV